MAHGFPIITLSSKVCPCYYVQVQKARPVAFGQEGMILTEPKAINDDQGLILRPREDSLAQPPLSFCAVNFETDLLTSLPAG